MQFELNVSSHQKLCNNHTILKYYGTQKKIHIFSLFMSFLNSWRQKRRMLWKRLHSYCILLYSVLRSAWSTNNIIRIAFFLPTLKLQKLFFPFQNNLMWTQLNPEVYFNTQRMFSVFPIEGFSCLLCLCSMVVTRFYSTNSNFLFTLWLKSQHRNASGSILK